MTVMYGYSVYHPIFYACMGWTGTDLDAGFYGQSSFLSLMGLQVMDFIYSQDFESAWQMVVSEM